MTKAQMAEMVDNLKGALKTTELARDEAREQSARLKARVQAHEQSYAALMDSYKAEKNVVEAMQERNRLLAAELRDMTEDRDNWRRDYLAMQDAHRKMRQNLFEQARLAGVLAVEGKGPFAGHADLSN